MHTLAITTSVLDSICNIVHLHFLTAHSLPLPDHKTSPVRCGQLPKINVFCGYCKHVRWQEKTMNNTSCESYVLKWFGNESIVVFMYVLQLSVYPILSRRLLLRTTLTIRPPFSGNDAVIESSCIAHIYFMVIIIIVPSPSF